MLVPTHKISHLLLQQLIRFTAKIKPKYNGCQVLHSTKSYLYQNYPLP